MSDDCLANQLKMLLEWEMPGGPFVGYGITQMIIENIHNLIVGNMREMRTAYLLGISFIKARRDTWLENSLPKRSATSI